jgi:hypothetical protein
MKLRSCARYLLLPAHATAVLLIACFSLGLSLAAAGGLLGLPLALLLLSWLFKYAFVLFDTAARGFDEPPVLSLEMVNPASEQRPLGQLLIVGTFYGATDAIGQYTHEGVATTLRALGIAALPASIAVLGSTRSILDAVNPRLLAGFIRRVGWDYLVLAGAAAACAAVLVLLPWNNLWMPVGLALAQYAALATFSVMGGVLYERRQELGLDAWRSPERTEEVRSREFEKARDREADEIYGHFRSGNRADAWAALQTVLEKQSQAPDVSLALYRRIATWPDASLANRMARQLLPSLLTSHRPSDALAVLRDRLTADPGFRPESGSDTLRLARLARSAGQAAVARKLLSDFERQFPGDTRAIHSAAELAKELLR